MAELATVPPHDPLVGLIYKELLYTPEEVNAGIRTMAGFVVDTYASQDTVFVSLLNGGTPLATKLMFAIAEIDPSYNPNLQYITVSSYGTGQTAKEPELVMGLPPKTSVEDKQVMMIDDIVDGGGTARFSDSYLRSEGANEVGLLTLGVRPREAVATYEPVLTVVQDELPPRDVWLTGMGLDHRRLALEGNRWFGGIAIALDLPPNPEIS